MTNEKLIAIVTSYCGGKDAEQKTHMTKTLCKSLKEKGFDVCLSTHSHVGLDIQQYCDIVTYDADNSFQINGVPKRNNYHGISELKLLAQASSISLLKDYTHTLKFTFDNSPDLDYIDTVSYTHLRAHET